MPDVTYPGVYVEEIPNGPQPIAGVSTATAVFVGVTTAGPAFRPVRCAGYGDFVRNFCCAVCDGELSLQLKSFFGNGGTDCYVVSIVHADGSVPDAAVFDQAYAVIDKEVNLFNLLVLPGASAGMEQVYPNASQLCRRRHALLLIDASPNWTSVSDAIAGVDKLRMEGLSGEDSAVSFPRLIIEQNGKRAPLAATGAVAGLFARTDAARGVWKAPAGTDAELRGAVDVEHRFSAGQIAVANAAGINTIRVLSHRVVNWGARTVAGADGSGSEYKYVPVRRFALYLEESIDRGLRWAVFEPNDESLWSRVRTTVGAFLNDLFRRGAFAGHTPQEAYFVKCDAQTTTQPDIDRGVFNVLIGFAAPKPAEFLIIRLQQTAGQASTSA